MTIIPYMPTIKGKQRHHIFHTSTTSICYLFHWILTLKKSFVEPEFSVPYLILVCFAKSSALSIGDSIFVMVKKAAKLAVYEEIMIRVKNHHIQLTIRVEIAWGAISQPSVQDVVSAIQCIELWIHSLGKKSCRSSMTWVIMLCFLLLLIYLLI